MKNDEVKAVCEWYFKLLMSDWRNHNLLMKLMHTMVNGGEERRRAHEENLKLGSIIGATYDAPSGKWNYSNVKQGYWDISGITGYSGYSAQPLTAYSLGDNDGWETTKARNNILSSQDYTAARSAGIPPYASYSTSGDTVYNDDHSLTINGMTLGSSMLSRPMSEIFSKFSLNMGT